MGGSKKQGQSAPSLSGVKAVARKDRLVGKRTRASHVHEVARGKKGYKRELEMTFSAWLAVG